MFLPVFPGEKREVLFLHIYKKSEGKASKADWG